MKSDVAVCLKDGIFFLCCFLTFLFQLWETTKVHTSSAICLKRDSDVLFSQEEIIVSAADNCNRLQVSLKRSRQVSHIYSSRPSIDACAYVCVS